MLAVLAYHLFEGTTGWLRGGWLGVDVFFVLSGFLITSLLLAEHGRWGRIDLPGFWLARARRLLPALFLVLLATCVAAAFWAPVARRSSDAWDIFSALCYVANWRFIFSDDQYFSSLSMPSPVQHTWSLAIEEQFYIVFPLLLVCLLLLAARFGRRRLLLAGPIIALALLSVWRMAALYVPGADPSRVYYGTDTRAFELLIGASFGVLLTRHEFGRGRATVGHDFGRGHVADGLATTVERVARWSALPALGVLVLAFIFLDAGSAVPFQGGMVLICLCAAAVIVTGAARTPSTAQRLLSWEPLRRLGLISYSLYLWHWPVIVFLAPPNLDVPAAPRAVLQIAVSVGLAYLTYRYVERPVRSGGLRALIPHRPAWGRAAAAGLVAALTVALVATPRSSFGAAAARYPGIQVKIPAYLPLTAHHSVTLIGNSIPDSLQAAFQQQQFPDLSVNADVSLGCDPFPGQKVIDGKAQPVGADCPGFLTSWRRVLHADPPDLAIFLVPQSITGDMVVDGKRLSFGGKAYLSWLQGMLGDIRRQALAAGSGRFAIGTLACHRVIGFTDESAHMNNDARVATINDTVRRWASSTGTPVLDFNHLLCAKGYSDTINGTQLYADGYHYTAQSGAVVWGWLAPQIQRILAPGT